MNSEKRGVRSEEQEARSEERGARSEKRYSRSSLFSLRSSLFALRSSLFSLLFFLLLCFPAPLLAQTDPTSTPDETGAIYVIVKPDDNLWNIAAAAGITVEQLRALNNLSESDFIQPGQRLLVGYSTPPASATPINPTPTATLPPPTATNTALPPPRTAVCLLAFADTNHNGIHEPTEGGRAAVAFTIYTAQAVITNYITDGQPAPYCLEGLSPGEYQITRSIGRGETLTTDGELTVLLELGQVIQLEFGSYLADETQITAVPITPTLLPQPIGATDTPRETAVPTTPPVEPQSGRINLNWLLLPLVVLIFLTVLFFRFRKTIFGKR